MIALYMWDSCPYCQKVLRATNKYGLVVGKDFQIIDAGPNTPGRLRVQQLGGKAMVPFMVDGDIRMYESDDIVLYLSKCLRV